MCCLVVNALPPPVFHNNRLFEGKMSGSRYAFSLTTFSPTGKLGQIEHALQAVHKGKTCLGIQGAARHDGPAVTSAVSMRACVPPPPPSPSHGWCCGGDGEEGALHPRGRDVLPAHRAAG